MFHASSYLPERNSASRHNPQQQQQQQSKSELQRKTERKIVTPHLPMLSLPLKISNH